MTRRVRGRAGRSAVHPLVLLSGLVLLAASGTAWTSGMTNVPLTSVHRELRDVPTFTVSSPAFRADSGATVADFTVASSDPDVPAGQLRARFWTESSPETAWQDCTISVTGPTWTCPVPGLTVAQATGGSHDTVATP